MSTVKWQTSGVGLEIFNAGGGWRDQKVAPPRSAALPSLRQGKAFRAEEMGDTVVTPPLEAWELSVFPQGGYFAVSSGEGRFSALSVSMRTWRRLRDFALFCKPAKEVAQTRSRGCFMTESSHRR
ncbi:hypothetical protein T10_8817 [Trichinella papuae]|uniref:Uncharacterized protein n=1 Tax=Trichinella papuae TaxID=268474 RepID=A0A0V1M5X4_9BILA|nr:hypothetical protein T10_8817 [Trichinella papuae]